MAKSLRVGVHQRNACGYTCKALTVRRFGSAVLVSGDLLRYAGQDTAGTFPGLIDPDRKPFVAAPRSEQERTRKKRWRCGSVTNTRNCPERCELGGISVLSLRESYEQRGRKERRKWGNVES